MFTRNNKFSGNYWLLRPRRSSLVLAQAKHENMQYGTGSIATKLVKLISNNWVIREIKFNFICLCERHQNSTCLFVYWASVCSKCIIYPTRPPNSSWLSDGGFCLVVKIKRILWIFFYFKTNGKAQRRSAKCFLCWGLHCVKSVSIQSFSGPFFPAFRLNTER